MFRNFIKRSYNENRNKEEIVGKDFSSVLILSFAARKGLREPILRRSHAFGIAFQKSFRENLIVSNKRERTGDMIRSH